MDRSVEGWVFISLGTLGEGWDEILEGLGIEDGISFGRSANGGERFEWKVVEFDGEVIAAWNDADEEDDEGGLGSGATDGPMTKRKVDAMTE